MEAQTQSDDAPGVSLTTLDNSTLVVNLSGAWRLQKSAAALSPVLKALESSPVRSRSFRCESSHNSWDSSVLMFLTKVIELCRQRNIDTEREGLPEGIRRLLELAAIAPEQQVAKPAAESAVTFGAGRYRRHGVLHLFVRDAAVSRRCDLGVRQAGRHAGALSDRRSVSYYPRMRPAALPIVTLISFLVGLIMAFVGAVQLQQFGAEIYVANLVAIAMAREMGAMMTGIIMAGRTGAAYAAQLGTMKVTQEIDALTTMGISPMDFLVLPRMIALCLMMPLLCLYADLMGILGGAAVGLGMLDVSRTTTAPDDRGDHVKTFAAASSRASVYGILVALSGCLRGMQCGAAPSAVGDAATCAVVTASSSSSRLAASSRSSSTCSGSD